MKNEIINNLLNYSMNNIGLYGKVIYDYPINQALKDESIVVLFTSFDILINFIKNLPKIVMIIFIYLTEKKKGALEEYSSISCSIKISQKASLY